MNIKINTKRIYIQDAKEGMVVSSYDIDKNKLVYKTVLNTFTPIVESYRQYELEFESGGTIVTSNSHPMLVYRNKWEYIPTEEVVVGDIVKTIDGTCKVSKINIGNLAEEQFYDIEVQDTNNYFATSNNSSSMYITHNSATTHFPIWHSEIEDILVLKNNKGSEDNRVRRLDYSIQLSKLFYQRFIEDKHITLFSPHEVPGLYDAFGTERFDDLYKKYERSRTVNKKKVKARDLFMSLLRERAETGRIYIMNIDHANEHSSFLDKVNMSNLCVAPETKILTKTGYIPISELENKIVSIWNGLQWSEVEVKHTGTNQKLIDVVIGDNFVITCTPYHKFYTVKSADDWNARRVEEKRACDLTSEDNITRFYCPFIEKGDLTMDDAYERGYASMRGDKFVPINNHTLDTRLKWLAGLLDAEGAMEKRSGNISFNVYSTDIDFLREVALLLQTLGCLSTIKKIEEEQFVQFPESNSKGYLFPAKYRITVLADDTYHKLSNLGLFSHTKVAKYNKPRLLSKRRRDNLYRVKEVRDLGRVDDTYCFTEPKRNMGMFNGCIAGNCQEITLPTKPIQHIDDEKGEIALCILSAINLGKIKDKQELEPLCDIAVRALDEIIDFQGYPVKAAELSTKARRSLGIGYIGVAHYLAKNKVKYNSQEAWQLMHDTTEAFQYYLIKASVNLACERGPCEKFNRTKYSQGILPIDTYKREVDEIITDPSLKMDWEALRQEVLEHGMRHSTLTAQMPSESSSVVSNATNGIEPPRGYLSIKKSKKGPLKQIVPGYYHFRNYYSLLWDLPNNEGYINIVAVMQKFFDQAISGNWSYNPEHYPNNEIPMSVMARDLLTTYKLGWKTSYYHNTYDAKKDEDEELPPLEQTNIQEESEEDCESCTI